MERQNIFQRGNLAKCLENGQTPTEDIKYNNNYKFCCQYYFGNKIGKQRKCFVISDSEYFPFLNILDLL